PARRPSGTSPRGMRRSTPSGVTATKLASFVSASAPTTRSPSSLLGRMRMTPRPGPASSATSSSGKRSTLPRRAATTSPEPSRARHAPVPLAEARPAPRGARRLGGVGGGPEAVSLGGGADPRLLRQPREGRLRALAALADEPRGGHPLAVAELEEGLHRL